MLGLLNTIFSRREIVVYFSSAVSGAPGKLKGFTFCQVQSKEKTLY